MADRGEDVPTPNQWHQQQQNQTMTKIKQQQNQQQQDQPQQQHWHLNLSKFKPEFSGKPDDNTEVHLLHANDWMNAHHFVDGVKIQRFCLTLLGEARLWYHSLETHKFKLAQIAQFV